MIISKVTNTINGKFYIGQTKQEFKVRHRRYKQDSKNGTQLIYNALRKYG